MAMAMAKRHTVN